MSILICIAESNREIQKVGSLAVNKEFVGNSTVIERTVLKTGS